MRRKWLWFGLGLLAVFAAGLAAALLAVPLPEPLFAQDYSTIVLDEQGRILRVFLNQNQQWALPDDGSEIPYKLKTAVVHYEDKRFYQHFGVDLLALARALYQNAVHRQRVSGASTITMQVARLMQPKPRTVKSKLIEMAQAVKIEWKYSKDEILKLYLLHAPYGSNIIGYRTASLRYFGKEPENLSWAEAATLAVLPNNPANVNPMQNADQLKIKRDQLLLRLRRAEIIDQETYELAAVEPLPESQMPFPLSAPHLAESLKRSEDQDIITTTIDKDLQDWATKVLQRYIAELSRHGIKNGALLIADTATGAVKAYVASQDYFDNDNFGKIDGVQMRRSGGSTLKPFLYALAMDEGLIGPTSVLPDAPISYGGYTPYNSDRSFNGIVRAGTALIRSLNAPAVYLLNQYGVKNFYDFLKAAGLKGLTKTHQDYGLSLVLGGCEVSLWELCALYRGLGTLGRFTDLHVLKLPEGQGPSGDAQLITPGSAYLVLEILAEVARPGLEHHWQNYASGVPLAWKTGTSYGSRDAWAAGVSPQWTVAVWVGNFDGSEAKGLTGIDAAAPLLFQVFNGLDKNPYQPWFACPEDALVEIEVSAATGYRLKTEEGQHTAKTETIMVPQAAKPLRYSPYERTVYLNLAETMQVCSLCWDRDDLKAVLRLDFPPEIRALLNTVSQGPALPPHNPECPASKQHNPVSIAYPQPNSYIFIPRDASGQYQRISMEVLHADPGATIFWYLDEQYLGETTGGHTINLAPDTGWHRLYVIDTAGNSQAVIFYAERR
jgi:penicillin-binding protein 1C